MSASSWTSLGWRRRALVPVLAPVAASRPRPGKAVASSAEISGSLGLSRLVARLQHEELDRHVRIDVDRAHVRDHLAAGRPFDNATELILRRLLEAAANPETDSASGASSRVRSTVVNPPRRMQTTVSLTMWVFALVGPFP